MIWAYCTGKKMSVPMTTSIHVTRVGSSISVAPHCEINLNQSSDFHQSFILLGYTSACCGSRTNETASTMAIAVAMVANSHGSLGSRAYITPPANEANMRGSVTT